MSRLGWALAQALLILVTFLCSPTSAEEPKPLWNPAAHLDTSRVHAVHQTHHDIDRGA